MACYQKQRRSKWLKFKQGGSEFTTEDTPNNIEGYVRCRRNRILVAGVVFGENSSTLSLRESEQRASVRFFRGFYCTKTGPNTTTRTETRPETMQSMNTSNRLPSSRCTINPNAPNTCLFVSASDQWRKIKQSNGELASERHSDIKIPRTIGPSINQTTVPLVLKKRCFQKDSPTLIVQVILAIGRI